MEHWASKRRGLAFGLAGMARGLMAGIGTGAGRDAIRLETRRAGMMMRSIQARPWSADDHAELVVAIITQWSEFAKGCRIEVPW